MGSTVGLEAVENREISGVAGNLIPALSRLSQMVPIGAATNELEPN
jgi:hypothetical protein